MAERKSLREAQLCAMGEEERAAFEAGEKEMRDRLYAERVAQSARIDNALRCRRPIPHPGIHTRCTQLSTSRRGARSTTRQPLAPS